MPIDSELADGLIAEIKRGNPLHGRVVDQALAALKEHELIAFQRYIAYCLDRDVSLAALAKAYNLIVTDTYKEEIYFRRHGRYRHSTYAAVADAVYQNPEYMRGYMHGLAVTEFLWENHAAMRRFFERCLAAARGGDSYLEVGPGHGFFFALAAKSRKWKLHHGVDISPTSLEMTRSFLQSGLHGKVGDYDLFESDFLQYDFRLSYDAFVMGEVLEHVEAPEAFLRRIFEVTSRDPFVFLTTCINAPSIDHIYNFETIENLEGMFHRAGFAIADRILLPYPGKTVEESIDEKLSISVAYRLSKP
ncbi:class I SAM-dependent methyltransferase [Steroidobacter flavus]|uniref:Class I SAM-dependent methyltransferase n=1 Tax=Steroidobacter flavus TaxID=1842136 RepID=A0ABV8T3W5_9GAMM